MLPGGGWPAETITEIYVERSGIGEMQLLMPAFARLTVNERWLMLIMPPYIPYAPALAARGVRLSHVLLLRVQDIGMQLWACEQALRSGICGAVLLWADRIQERALRRIQLAAEGSGSIVMLFRGAKTVPVTSASLRLHLSKAENRTIVRILKRRGGGIHRQKAEAAFQRRWTTSFRYRHARRQTGTLEAVALSAKDGTLDCLVQVRVRFGG